MNFFFCNFIFFLTVIARSGSICYWGIAHSGLANLEDWSNCKIVYCGPRKKIALPTSDHYKKTTNILHFTKS
jgi:hypothetical protein